MKKKFLLLLAVLLCASCSHVSPPAKANMLKNKTFVHLLYDTEKECLDNQPDPDFYQNCFQQVDFKKNNEVELMLTDIFWIGKYHLEGDRVILTFTPNYEIPDGIVVFELLDNNTLWNVDEQTTWKKMNGNSIWK